MPRIHIANLNVTIGTKPSHSLLNSFFLNNIAIHTLCGGHAQCGCCRIRILAGAKGMNAPNQRERDRLGNARLEQGWRLACQSYTLRDITIHLPSADELDLSCSRK